MHDSEQEHRGITGCRVTYESTIFYCSGLCSPTQPRMSSVRSSAATGRHHSSIYTPQQSIALTQLMYDIRMAWGMKFEGEE